MIEDKEIVISTSDLSKKYKLYNSAKDRIKEAFSLSKKKYHQEHFALKDVSLDLRKGETIGLIGKNGAGKSTLLKVITGIVTPSSGEIKVVGRIASLLELGAGFNMELTGIDNIYLNGTLMGLTRKEVDEKINGILEFADIGEFIHQPVKMYSSGMFARLAFSVAINVDPDILIIDEALSVGDLRFQLKCMEKFNDIRRAGKTIIFVSHDINAIKRFCTYSVWICDGEVREVGNTDTVTDAYLDYLKLSDRDSAVISNDVEAVRSDIAQIKNTSIRGTGDNTERREFNYLEDVYVTVTYEVYDDSVDRPVLGVAINTLDNKNICGLNTLLDGIEIPWELGLNSITLHYKEVSLIGGTYSIDAALFEENASVSFDYKQCIDSVVIRTPYVGEGVYIIKHSWQE